MLPRHLYIFEWPNGALSVYDEPRLGAVEYIAEECVEECAHCRNARQRERERRAAGGAAGT